MFVWEMIYFRHKKINHDRFTQQILVPNVLFNV